jgi:hypothetical protein
MKRRQPHLELSLRRESMEFAVGHEDRIDQGLRHAMVANVEETDRGCGLTQVLGRGGLSNRSSVSKVMMGRRSI